MAVANFYLLGAFEVEIGEGDRMPVGDSTASKILAYLAYRNEFCTNEEIIRACWGKHKVEGEDKLEDQAYKRQVSNLRSLLTDLGLPFDDYLLTQPNGLTLREGTFATDVIRFDELLRVGLNRSIPSADRLTALQEAEGLRRGYLLDGQRCEWIVTHEGGARSDYGAKFQEVRREIQQLQRPSEPGGRAVTVAVNRRLPQKLPQSEHATSVRHRLVYIR